MNRNPFVRPRSYFIGAAALVLLGVTLGLGLSAGLGLQRTSTAEHNANAVASSTAPLPESPFVGVVEKALPAVVFVDVRKKIGGADSQDPQDDFMRRFFGEVPHRTQRVPTSGSGFIIDSDGHILTNNHVVRDADEINVTLNDKRTFKAKVVGADAQTDVAVIKIEGDHLPVLPLGDSEQLRVGDWAIAIGNPLGELRGSVTVGIISAQGRNGLNIFGGTPEFQDFIQTDASINFGNSGGPLCNIRGEAIGINTAINTAGQGIGFAVPINLAKHVAEQLMASGSVKRAMMGVLLADLTPEIKEGFGIANDQDGVVVQNVIHGSPAERAGIKRNDVIVEFDGQPVTDMQKFRLRVADTPSGKRVPMTLLRDGKRVPVSVTLSNRDEKLLAQGGGGPGHGQDQEASPQSAQTLAGITVRDLTSAEKSNLGSDSGVMITEVKDGSAADEAGLQANDVIEEVNRKPAASTNALATLLRDAKTAKKTAVLLVHRGTTTQFVPIKLDR